MTFVPFAAVLVLGALATTHRLAAQAPDGRDIYSEECKSCHGVNGAPPQRARAKYKKIRTVGDSGFVTGLSLDSIVTVLRRGIDTDMKSFKEKLSDPEIRAVATYIRTLGKKD